MKTTQWEMKSKIGSLFLVASEKGLQGVFWKKRNVPLATSLNADTQPLRYLNQAYTQLNEYLDGKRTEFTIPLDIQGTPFQKTVWNELRNIRYGETKSYRDIAQKIKNEKAFRAVGTANGKNPISLIIPCHRVIASDGTLGGYAGGLKTKEILLKIEQNAQP